MNVLRTVLAMTCSLVLSASFLSAQQRTADPRTTSPSQRINRVRIPSYLAESMTQRIVLPRDKGIPGDVVLELLVMKDGRVLKVRGVSGDSRLLRATKPAMMKWVFIPFFRDGEPVQFLTELTIQFDGKKHFGKLKFENDPLSPHNAQQVPANRAGWVLNFDGIGAVRVGMTLSQVNAAIGENFSTPTAGDEQACFYVEPKQHPDTGIMMLDGRVARVDVFVPDSGSPSTVTATGIHIGDSEARVKSVYGNKVQVSPHHYTDGYYLTIESGIYGLRFETDGSKVMSFYGGTLRAIALVEGCS